MDLDSLLDRVEMLVAVPAITAVVVLGVLGGACRGPSTTTADTQPRPDSTVAPDSLKRTHRQKLDHAITLLLREGPDNPFFEYQVRSRSDSVAVYGVLIRTNDPAALAESVLGLGDGEATILTAFLTVEEIRQAARLEAVTSIANPSRAELH